MVIPLILKHNCFCVILNLIWKPLLQLFRYRYRLEKLVSTYTCNVYMILIYNWLLNLIHLLFGFWNLPGLIRIVWIRENKINLSSLFNFFGFMKPLSFHIERIEILSFSTIIMLFKSVKYPLFFWLYYFLFLKNSIEIRPVYLGWEVTIVEEAYLNCNSISFWFW